ncbi:MAG: glycosyltransferase family 2 protein [Nocardioides sp.]
MSGGLVVLASTVKDTLANVQRYVDGNLAGGADHLVVFLDAPSDPGTPAVRELLDAHPHVTCVVTDDSWWTDKRPEQLNTRQRVNANVVKALLSTVDWADWVFHVDADEVVQLSRSVLDGVPDDRPAVTLAPLEAVSRKHWDGDPTWFKKLLEADDLTLLKTLGVIDRPSNGALFHGHVEGKSGVRPTTDLWLALHHVVDEEKAEVTAFTHEELRLLHYESYSGEDFVRKWTSILAAGPKPAFRPAREPTAIALQTLIAKGLSPEIAERYLMRIFELTTEDDFETLRDLDLLENLDPRAGSHVPAAVPDASMASLLEGVRGEPKRPFHHGTSPDKVEKILSRAGRTPRRIGRAARR